MNIVTAVRRRLMEETELVGMGRVDKFKLQDDVGLTGKIAVVVSVNGSWRQNQQTAKYPRLAVLIYADDSRNEDGSVRSEDGFDKAMNAWQVVDSVMHRPTSEAVWWGGEGSGVLVLHASRETEASQVDHPVSTTAVLRATYDLKVC